MMVKSGLEFFFLEKPVFFRAKYKTVIRRGPNAILSLLLSGGTASSHKNIFHFFVEAVEIKGQKEEREKMTKKT